MGEMTPVLAMDHLRLREASQRTTRVGEDPPWPGSEAEAGLLEDDLEGGKSLATQRSPWAEGVSR